ncbi:DUF3810 domain-containing protein [Algoriphagus halophytocola]|uniref:DUF3810 domain-containing protein n=1 Tax=Algoriphagus halophytocola TaxID=2991499 RepID=A0ABY6MC81_9BACT|nr:MULTISPECIES: DUF3810 domain-containing protein [unclassified Algoriphagus]UZD21048.1 DUF3810 domain-containing protein [Algoriphagus sp. TR-M5]WBL42214.1 DUF3810 domain-containing protein [Algoriphagus sp. TR-M9]
MGKRDWSWAILGVIALGIRYLAAQNPEATDEIYSRIFFPGIRNVIDMTLGRLPFPSVYLFIVGVLLILGLYFLKLRKKNGWKSKVMYSTRALANGVGALVFFFLVLWGFNYQRTPIVQQLGLQPKSMNLDEMKNEVLITQRLAIQYRNAISSDTAAIESILPYPELEKVVRATIADNLDMLGLNFTGRPRTKLFPPPGFMRKMGILGIYFPFTGESYIDPTLHALEKPFTIAHEMAHSYGVTDEGEANFIAWVICTNSDDPLLRYSGQLRLLNYLLSDYYRMAPEEYKTWVKTLDPGIRNDLISLRKASEAIKPFSIELSRKTNDVFLKTQGVKAGVKSYQQLPKLAFAWRERMKGH